MVKSLIPIVEIIDLEKLKNIFKKWSLSTGMGVVMKDVHGNLIVGPYGISSYCKLLHQTPWGMERCIQAGNGQNGSFVCYAGLEDYAMPIYLPNGDKVGTILCGQVTNERLGPPDFAALAYDHGIAEANLQNEYLEVTFKSQQVAQACYDMLHDLVESFIEKHYREWMHRNEKVTDRTLSEIIKFLYSYNLTIDMETLDFKLVTGKGMERAVAIMQQYDNILEAQAAVMKFIHPDYLEKLRVQLAPDRIMGLGQKRGFICSHEYLTTYGEWHEITVFADIDDNGKQFINILGRDVTQQHEMANTKAQLEVELAANEAKLQFLSNMSHDIRTPINGIIGMLDIARQNRSDAEKVDGCLSKIDISAHYLLTLINDILDLNKLESGKMRFDREPFNLNTMIQELQVILQPMADRENIAFSMQEDTELEHPDCMGSPVHIRQILINLLSNAIKYNREGGSVKLTVTDTEFDGQRAYYTFCVEDTGIGMSQSFQEKMFEAFDQEDTGVKAKYKGSGLGLAIVKRIVEAMDGTISFKSVRNIGTTFWVKLPLDVTADLLSQQVEQHETVIENMDELHFDNFHVLLVEDNEINMEISQYMLENVGITVDKAWDGQQAVSAFEAAKPGTFDMIFMDVKMPNMNGLEATRMIHRLEHPDAKGIPIIAMTANTFEEDVQNCQAASMTAHLAKPIEPNAFYVTIKKYYDKKKCS